MLRIDTIHTYEHPVLGTPAHCRLRIFDTETGAVVIFSELADNTGISVTNATAILATEIANVYRLNRTTTRWIEHYNRSSYRHAGEDMTESFDEITYTWSLYGVAEHPQWKHLVGEELEIALDEELVTP